MESFRALKFSNQESFRALKYSFRVLDFSNLDSFRAPSPSTFKNFSSLMQLSKFTNLGKVQPQIKYVCLQQVMTFNLISYAYISIICAQKVCDFIHKKHSHVFQIPKMRANIENYNLFVRFSEYLC